MEIFFCTELASTQQLLHSLPPHHYNPIAPQYSIAIAKLEAIRTEAC